MVSLELNLYHQAKGHEMKIVSILVLILVSIPGFSATITANIKGTVSEVATIQKVLPVVEKIINSEEFRQKVLSSKFTYTKLTNEEIYKKIVANDWQLHLVFEKQGKWAPFTKSKCKSTVLGWTYPSTKTVWFNRCNFEGRKLSGIAGTVCHETAHKLGFTHPFQDTKTRPQSVPYSVGTICANMFERFK